MIPAGIPILQMAKQRPGRASLAPEQKAGLDSPTQRSLCTWKPGGQMQRNEPSRFWQVPGRQVPERLKHSLVSVERKRRGPSTSP